MSADNYGVIHRHGDGFGLSMGFASDERPCDLSRPYITNSSLEAVVEHADTEYFEYGWDYDSDLATELAFETTSVKKALGDAMKNVRRHRNRATQQRRKRAAANKRAAELKTDLETAVDLLCALGVTPDQTYGDPRHDAFVAKWAPKLRAKIAAGKGPSETASSAVR